MRIHDFCSRQKKIIFTRRRLIKFTGGGRGEEKGARVVSDFSKVGLKRGEIVRWMAKRGIKGRLVSFLSRFQEAINLAHNWILFYAWRLSAREGRDFSAFRAVKWKITCRIKHSRSRESNLVIKIIGEIIIERGNKNFFPFPSIPI